jgi:hypothetical protein
MKITLRKYYEDKRRRYHLSRGFLYDRDLNRMFRTRGIGASSEPAAKFLQRMRPAVRKLVADRTGAFQYDIDRLVREMIERSAELELMLPESSVPNRPGSRRLAKQSQRRLSLRVAAHLVRYVHEGHHRYVR